MPLSILVCVFLVLPIFADRAHSGHLIPLNSPSSDESSYVVLPQEVLKYVFSTSIAQIYFITSATKTFKTNSYFFKNLTSLLMLALIVILLLLTLSLYRMNKLKSKTHKFLENKNNELREAKEAAESVTHAKTRCLSTISHELRTPLNSLTGITQLLLNSEPKPEQWEYLNALKLSCDYLMSLVNNVLMLSKLEAERVNIQNTSFRLKKTIESILNLLNESARTNNTEIHLEYDSNLPEEIVGDSIKVSQILINLIGNATQFTTNGQIWVRVFGKSNTADKVEIQIEVEDTGEGIPKAEQQLIFESYAQGLLPKNRRQGGTGLGLAIVKGLLELLESQIHLESELGKGSKFWFILPFYYIPSSPNQPILKINNEEETFLANKSVLLVEDDLISQMITKKLLESKKMKCVITDNGEDAIKLIKDKGFHLVLMDLSIRGISGLEATKAIRRFNNEIPIIALTALEIEENSPELNDAGFNDIIPKPFKIDDLFEKIQIVLNQGPHALPTDQD